MHAVILDLDDTIFRTKSMSPETFSPFFERLRFILKEKHSSRQIDEVISELWIMTWDAVMTKHAVDMEMMREATTVFDGIEICERLLPYPDYVVVQKMECRKFLVSSSVTSLQNAKIRALGIHNDFERVVIVDPFLHTYGKKEAFEALQKDFGLQPENTFVIGDNDASEIAAGNALGFTTVQILREGVKKGNNAKYFIGSFEQLPSILENGK
jgi:HAD superfamily hydrolase (TIGR01549 family)